MENNPSTDRVKKSRFSRFTALRSSALEDYHGSTSKRRTKAIGALLVGTQIPDRCRLPILVIPPVVIETMEQHNNSLLAGAVGAGMFAVWSGIIGEPTLRVTDEFPKTVVTFNEEFPAVVGFFADVLPGIEKGGPTHGEPKSILSRIGLRVRRSLPSLNYGNFPFVMTSRATGYTSEESRKLYVNTGLDGAGLVFTLGAATTEAVKRLTMAGQYQTAENIQNILSNNKTWWIAAAASVAGELVNNKIQARRYIRESQEQTGDSDTASTSSPVDKSI